MHKKGHPGVAFLLLCYERLVGAHFVGQLNPVLTR